MKNLFLFISVIWISTLGCAPVAPYHFLQQTNIVTDTPAKQTFNGCNDKLNFAPDLLHPEFTPIRYLRVNIHFIRRRNGNGNFSNEEGKLYAWYLIHFANNSLMQNTPMKLPVGNNTPALPIRIQLVLTGDEGNTDDGGVYFHDDDDAFLWKNIAESKQYDKYGKRKGEVLNIFMMEWNPDSLLSKHFKAKNDGVGMGTWCKIINAYHAFKDTIDEKGNKVNNGAWVFVGLLKHEIGHCLGLAHTYNENDGCEDTPKNNNCWGDGPPPCQTASNNVMDYNQCQCAYTPCQLGIIHKNFFTENSLQRKMLRPDWCTLNYDSTVFIKSGDSIVWNGGHELIGDLVIESGASLTIRCILGLPGEAKIKLESGSTLVLDGATITNRCNEKWDGIEISSSKKNKPIIIMKNGASLENVIHPIEDNEKPH